MSSGWQPILRNKMENDNYYLLTLAAIAKEIQRCGEKRERAVTLGAGLLLAGLVRKRKRSRNIFSVLQRDKLCGK